MNGFVRFFHLLGAMVWVGGLITLGALVPTLRRAGADREMLRAVARQFARVSWTAFGVAVVTGAWAAPDHLDSPAFPWKVAAVAITAGLTLWHTFGASGQSPRTRGILQGLILLSSLGIVVAAINL